MLIDNQNSGSLSGHSYAVHRLPTGHFYVKKLGNVNSMCERQLKLARSSNDVLKNIVEDLKAKNGKIEGDLQELKSQNSKTNSELESGSAELIITKQELHDCKEELEDEIQKNKNLETQNSISLKSLEEFRSSASTCPMNKSGNFKNPMIRKNKLYFKCW